MIKEFQKIELLAPAKDKDCAFAAIKAGADAVYIGASDFGARKNAGNSLDDIKQIVDYAHLFNVKIYVTLNTILFDNEVAKVEEIVWELYKIKVDAIIFQDFSFFEMNLPPIALHASTQCNNDSLDKIKFLEKMNVERVVLPREFSLEQIKEVTSSLNLETEVFIHGALCVSYSGQCYLSNHIGGRSANRGECAQPCRKKYSLVDNKGKTILKQQYLLSMKDNNMSAHLKELLDAGVTSLKIEGRLKDKDYVANVTAYYRKLLDSVSPDIRPSTGRLTCEDFEPDVDKTFNRTYTDFFFDGKRKTFINPNTPKFTGEYIGKVKSVSGNRVVFDKRVSLNVSDKICYFTSSGELTGSTVTKVFDNTVELLNAKDINKNTRVYRNFDFQFAKKLEKAQFERKLPVKFFVKNDCITANTQGAEVKLALPSDVQRALNPQSAKSNLQKQLAKLGDTDFFCKEVKVADDFDKFFPVSQINEFRRLIVDLLLRQIAQNYKTSERACLETYPEYSVKNLDYSFNVSNEKSKNFYQKCSAEVLEYSPEVAVPQHQIVLMKTKHCLRDFAGICLKNTRDSRKLFLKDEYDCIYPLEFDCKNCIMKIFSNC